MRCIHCGLPVYRDNQGDWVDETEGDGCLQESPENQVHEVDISQADGFVFECDGCNFYGENTEKVCPECGTEISDTWATPFAYEKPESNKGYTWELPWDDDDPHRAMFGEGTTAMITDGNDKVIAYCPTASALDIVGALRGLTNA